MNDINISTDIKKVVSSINVISLFKYSMNGLVRDISKIKIIDPSGNLNTTETDSADHTKNFYNVLTTDIYNHLYMATEASRQNSTNNNNDFIIKLSQANNGLGTWEDGWVIVEHDKESDKFIIQKSQTKFWVNEQDILPENQTFTPETPCSVKVEKEQRYLNANFYVAFGNAAKKDITNYENRLLRFYWNLTPGGAIDYIKLITEYLNQENVHFRTKVISNPELYNRADAGVLYIDSSQLDIVVPLVIDIQEKLKCNLKTDTPLFSRFIAKGLGFAEDPANGTSFGISRSKLLAHAIYDSFLANKTQEDDILNFVAKCFDNEGIDPKHPYASKIKLKDYEGIFKKLIN